jgi:uncharacterized protein YdaU (DUF1376 family)
MPFYVADYLADTGHLSTLEHGAYMLLIMHYWQHRELPTDDAKLARISRMTPDEWGAVRPTLVDLFDEDWTHARIDAELAKADETIGKRKAAGKAGASARYGKGNASVMANAEQTDRPSPSPTPSEEGSLRSPSAREAETPPAESTRTELDALERQLREAAGLENHPAPALFDLSPIKALIAKGYSLENDVLPKLRDAKARGKSGRSWSYYVPSITEAHEAAARIAPKPQAPVADAAVWITEDDPRWARAALLYAESHDGKKPRAYGSRHQAGLGFSFPSDVLAQLATSDTSGTFQKMKGAA